MILHVTRRELAARWILLPAAIAIGALAMIAIQSIGHVRGDADGIMNGTWVGTLVVSTIVGMSLLSDELTNSRLSFYFARPFAPHTIFGGKLVAGVLVALLVQIAIMLLVALALPELSWRGSVLAKRDVLSVGGERILATIGCTLLGMAASIALGSKTRWFVLDVLGVAVVGVIATWFTLRLEPDPAWLPANASRSLGEKALFHAAAFGVAAIGLGIATARAFVLGRTDRMRAHRTLSTTLWPLVVPALAVLLLLGEQTTPSIPDPPALPDNVLVAPAVERADVVATEDRLAPYLLVLDDAGFVRLGAAASWAKLDAKHVRLARQVRNPRGDNEALEQFLQARIYEGISGELAVASVSRFDEQIDDAIPQEVARASQRMSERIPPPRGQPFDLELLAEEARLAGSLGAVVDRDSWGYPRRHALVYGSIRTDRRIRWRRALLFAAATTRAKFLIDVVAATRASIAVSHAHEARPLRLAFNSDAGAAKEWIELRVSTELITIEAVPGTPVEITDLQDLAAAIDHVRDARGIDAREAVDVLVDDGVTTQRLVDILVALDIGGVRAIGIGHMPGLTELALRGHHIPTTSIDERCRYPCGRIATESMRANRVKISRCYSDALVGDPNLSGVVRVKVHVDRYGKITSATASGVDPTLAECIAGVFRASAPSKHRSTSGPNGYDVTLRP